MAGDMVGDMAGDMAGDQNHALLEFKKKNKAGIAARKNVVNLDFSPSLSPVFSFSSHSYFWQFKMANIPSITSC